MKSHYLYRLTNPATGDFYVGVRSCDGSPEDDRSYKGSGRWPRSCAFHRVDLRKEILATFPTRAHAEDAEGLLIDIALLDALCCNSMVTASAAFKATSSRQCRAHLPPNEAGRRAYG